MPHGRGESRAYEQPAVSVSNIVRLVSRMSAVALFVGATLASSEASACASCGAGDPTLQVVGSEQPYEGRVRLAVVAQHMSYSDSEATAYDQRLQLGASVALGDVATITAVLPVVWREVTYASLAHDSVVGWGDLDARLRVTLFRDRPFAPRHRLFLDLGSRIPTGLVLSDARGLLPVESQVGSGALEPLLGLGWITIEGDVSVWAQALAAFPFTGTDGWRNGASVRTQAALQWQPEREIALRAHVDARIEGQSGRALDNLTSEPAVLLFGGGGVVWSPESSWVLNLLVRVPFFQHYDAAHAGRSEGVVIEAGAAFDV